MDAKILDILTNQAQTLGISVSQTFAPEVDSYIARHFSTATEKDRVIIETYLSNAALHIGRTERSKILDRAHAKAAVWLFHQPDSIDDTCAEAGRYALNTEQYRRKTRAQAFGSTRRTILSEGFAKHLDTRGEEYRRYY